MLCIFDTGMTQKVVNGFREISEISRKELITFRNIHEFIF